MYIFTHHKSSVSRRGVEASVGRVRRTSRRTSDARASRTAARRAPSAAWRLMITKKCKGSRQGQEQTQEQLVDA